MRWVLVGLGVLLLATAASAEEYWLHHPRGDWTDVEGQVVLYNPTSSSVDVQASSVAGPQWSMTLSPGQVRTKVLPVFTGTEGHVDADRTLKLLTTAPIQIQVTYDQEADSRMATVLEHGALGADYVVMGGMGTTHGDSPLVNRMDTEFVVIATQDDTEVTIEFNADTHPYPLEPMGVAAGATRTLILDAYTAWHVTSDDDLGGSRITTDRPVAVMEGGTHRHGAGAFSDHSWEQASPIKEGRIYPVCVAHDHFDQKYDVVRIMATTNTGASVSVTRHGTFSLTGQGAFRELQLTENALIVADEPVQVMRYTSHDVRMPYPEASPDSSMAWLEDPTTQASTQHIYVHADTKHVVMATAKGSHALRTSAGSVYPSSFIGGYGCYQIEHSGRMDLRGIEGVHAYALSAGPAESRSTSTRVACADLPIGVMPAPVATMEGSRLTWEADVAGRPCRDHGWEVSMAEPGNVVATLGHAARAWTAPLPEPCTSESYWLRGTWPNGTTDWVGPLQVYVPEVLMPIRLSSDVSDGVSLSWVAGLGSCETGLVAIQALVNGSWMDLHTTTDEQGSHAVDAAPCARMAYRVTFTTNTTELIGNSLALITPGCPEGTQPESSDADGDGAPDGLDNCEALVNWEQKDSDGDGMGDACDEPAQEDIRVEEHVPDCELMLPQDARMNASSLHWGYEEDCPITGFTVWTHAPVAWLEHTGTEYQVPPPEGDEVYIQVETGASLPELVPGRYVRVEIMADEPLYEEPEPMEHAPANADGAAPHDADPFLGEATAFGLLALTALFLLLLRRRRT